MKSASAMAMFAMIAGMEAAAQVAGSTQVGVELVEAREIAAGWSVKKSLLGRDVFNEKSERVGKIDDIIIAPDRSASFVIVGAGGFVGLARHDVAIPVDMVHEERGRIEIPGATTAAVKAMPAFEYAPPRKQ